MSLLQASPQVAYAQDVESFVQGFYNWYLKQSLSFIKQNKPFEDLPVFDQAIFKYVCRCTAKRVQFDYNRGVSADDSDYYMRRQDYGKEQLDNLMVGKTIAVNESLNLVPVSMSNQKEYNPYLVVYVEKIKGGMCISKVECTPGPNLRAPVY